MSQAQFVNGFVKTILQRGVTDAGRNLLRRDLAESDFNNAELTELRTGVTGFYTAHQVIIENPLRLMFVPRGMSGGAWGAGHDLAFFLIGFISTFDVRTYGDVAVAAMNASATAIGPRSIGWGANNRPIIRSAPVRG